MDWNKIEKEIKLDALAAKANAIEDAIRVLDREMRDATFLWTELYRLATEIEELKVQ